MRHFWLGLFVLVALAGCAAGPAATPAPARLRVSGSTSMGPALHELAAAFQAANQNVLIEIEGGGTAIALDDLRAGRVDVAALSWWDPARPALEDVRLAPVARDAIAVIVHASNPITNITALQLRSLFQGEVLDWGALGGDEGEPALVSREEGSGTRGAFEALVMGGQRVSLNALVMPTSQAVVDYVAAHRLAVGYVSSALVDEHVRVVPVEGLLPDDEAVASGAYHLSRVLYLAVREPPAPAALAFLDFAQAPAGQKILGGYHVPFED